MTVELVDPTAERRAPRRLAPGVSSEAPRVGLVDGMLNKRGQWGQGLLDAAEVVLRGQWPQASFTRVMLDPLDRGSADRWAQVMAARYEALVIAAGD